MRKPEEISKTSKLYGGKWDNMGSMINSFALACGLSKENVAECQAPGGHAGRSAAYVPQKVKFVYVPYLFTLFKILDDGGFITSRDGNNTLYKATR